MSQVTDIIAFVFDFDDTLLPDSLTALLKAHGIDSSDFWEVKVKSLIGKGYDPPSAYLKLILDNVGDGKPFGKLTNQKLRDFGATLDTTFYPGLPQFFDDVRAEVKGTHVDNVEVEFYIISGGLQAILEGSSIVRKYFSGYYGCRLAGETEDGVLTHVKRSITFTEKTRYLFEINKGVRPHESEKNAYEVNRDVEDKDRRVPFPNMIYIGDGLTDVPCFSLIDRNKGLAFGIFDPEKKDKAKQALEKYLLPRRVRSIHKPNYSPNEELGSILRTTASTFALRAEIMRSIAIRRY